MQYLNFPRLYHYLLAVVIVFAVTLLRMAFEDIGILERTPLLLFAFAVVLSSWYGGFGPGMLATGISTLVIDYFFFEPAYHFDLLNPQSFFPLLLFVLQGACISWLGGSNRKALLDLQGVQEELEERVAQRTAALTVSNTALAEQVELNQQIVEELRDQTGQLQRSNRELEDFASVASHDLQEPLRKIQAFGDRLRAKEAQTLSPEGRDYLDRMQNAAGRMSVLINDLLAFSRVTTRAQPFETVELQSLVEDVISDLETRIEQTAARVEITELPTIDADPLQMRQLFQNLISNGLKFRRPDVAPVVRVTARRVDISDDGDRAARSHCEIEVADNGIGFDEKYLDRIFNIFQRLHGRGIYEGTGIGLAVCRKIVERHGGTITARSQEGVGSTFIITLPIEQPAANELPHAIAT